MTGGVLSFCLPLLTQFILFFRTCVLYMPFVTLLKQYLFLFDKYDCCEPPLPLLVISYMFLAF